MVKEEPKKRERVRWRPWSGRWWMERELRKSHIASLERRSEVLSDILAEREPFFYPEEKREFERLFNDLGHHKGPLTFKEALKAHNDELKARIARIKRGEDNEDDIMKRLKWE